ncbi:hypothetical protein HYFRA_00014221, partial [Hymenoscyphus fraxineus]
MAALNPLVSKARKIIDLNNVPLVTGTSFIKWHLPSSTSTEHRGRTSKAPIVDHKVSYAYTKVIPLRLTIDKSNNLLECPIHFEVLQDFDTSSPKPERVVLGELTLNLSEYVEESEMTATGGEEDGVTRRYLMMESKINSTLKVGICMKQVDGERNFVAPPLKSAPVFGGIAGIMAGDGGDKDKQAPVLSTKPRDQGELQDMYRLALAASWAAQANELSADECIEDIFNGGTGWKEGPPSLHPSPPHSTLSLQTPTQHTLSHTHDLHHWDHDDNSLHGRRDRAYSTTSLKSQHTITKKASLQRMRERGHKHSGSQETVGFGRGGDGEGD